MNRNEASFMPDMEDWWGDGQPASQPSRQKRPARRAQDLPPPKNPAPTRRGRKQESRQGKFLMYMALGVVLIGLFLEINRYAEIASATKRVASLAGEIKQLESDGSNLKLRLATRENLTRVRDEAMYSLGMNYPADEQTRVIAGYAQYAEAPAQTAARGADLAR